MQQINRCVTEDHIQSQYSKVLGGDIEEHCSVQSESRYLSIVAGRYPLDKLTELVNRFGWKVIEIQEDHCIAANELLGDSCVVVEKSTANAGRPKRSLIDKKAKVLDINLTDFLRWCENRNDEIVGYAGSNWIGPIACYLKNTIDCSSVLVMPGCVKLDDQCFQPPYWFDYVEESLEETGSVSILGLDVVETLKSYIQFFSAISNSQEKNVGLD